MSVLVSANPRRRLSVAQWRRWEDVGLKPSLELDELVLNWTDYRVKDLDAKGALVALSIDRTIEGASTITMTLRDPDRALFSQRRGRTRHGPRNRSHKAAFKRDPVDVDEGWQPILPPDIIGRAVELELDGVVFRLVKVRHTASTEETELTFEDRIVYWLKRKRGTRRASKRSDVTRAEFILSLLREVKGARYRFVCPELHTRQPVDNGKTRKTSRASSASSSSSEQSGGFAPNANVTVKGVKATKLQRQNIDGVLTECQAQGCSADVMVATVCCITQESESKLLGYGDAAGPDSRGLFQQRAPWGSLSARLDPRRSCRMFLTGGAGGQAGWRQKHGSLKRVPGSIESAVKAVQVSVGGYQQWADEARRTVNAWGGAGSADAEAAGTDAGTYTRSYQFVRNKGESSWECMKRLADEVGWRIFVVGNSVYYMSERDLYARRARYTLDDDDPAVLELVYDVDWGKPVSELSTTVSLERWGAPPGSVIVVDGFGPPDGRWLVTAVRRDYFEPTAEVSCSQPGKAKLEPAAEQAQRASSSESSSAGDTKSGDKTQRLRNVCRALNDKGYPYTWGGGHAVVGRADGGTGRDPGPGLDCSGSTAAVLGALGLGVHTGQRGAPIHSSQFGSLPGAISGRGDVFTVCFNNGHVYIRFEGGGPYERFDTSMWSGDANSQRGPRLRSGQGPPGDSGYSLCHWRGW